MHNPDAFFVLDVAGRVSYGFHKLQRVVLFSQSFKRQHGGRYHPKPAPVSIRQFNVKFRLKVSRRSRLRSTIKPSTFAKSAMNAFTRAENSRRSNRHALPKKLFLDKYTDHFGQRAQDMIDEL